VPDLATSLGLSAVVSGTVGGGVGLWTKNRQLDYTLRRQHAQEERKKLRDLIGRYQGRMLEAALDWDRRMTQLYDGHFSDLRPGEDGRLDDGQYYYQSVVFRFLSLMSLSRRFEAEAFYIDAKVAEDDDFDLLRYAKAFLWVMIHPEITPDDGQPGLDHFRSDSFRPLLDLCHARRRRLLPETRSEEGWLIFDRPRYRALRDHRQALEQAPEVDELLAFFDGIAPRDLEERDAGVRLRRRWDRIVVSHLLVLAFVGRCEYSWQRGVEPQIQSAAGMLLYPDELLSQLGACMDRLGLGDQPSTAVVLEAVREAARRRPPEETAEARAARVERRVEENRRAARDARLGAESLHRPIAGRDRWSERHGARGLAARLVARRGAGEAVRRP
jgi:hypothetical protein